MVNTKLRINILAEYLKSFKVGEVKSKSSDSRYFHLDNNTMTIRISDHFPLNDFTGLAIIVSPLNNNIIIAIDKRFEIYNSMSEVKAFLKSFVLIYEFWNLKRLRFEKDIENALSNTSFDLESQESPFDISKFTPGQQKSIKNLWKQLINAYKDYKTTNGI